MESGFAIAFLVFLLWLLIRPAKKRRNRYWRDYRSTDWGVFAEKNELPQGGQALKIVSQTDYRVQSVLGYEEAHVLYRLEDWVRGRGRGERVFPQVPMGTYLKTPDDVAHRLIGSKRPDYVVVNRKGLPVCVVEYQGGGHFQGNSEERDAIKRAALKSAKIPLVEIFGSEKDDASLVRNKLDAAVDESHR